MKTAQEAGAPAKIVETVVAVNDARKHAMAEKIVAAFGGVRHRQDVAVLGLTFKPNTDDMRDAPSLVIIPALQQRAPSVRAHDPQAMHEAEKLARRRDVQEPYEAAKAPTRSSSSPNGTPIARSISPAEGELKEPLVVDLRNIYSRKK